VHVVTVARMIGFFSEPYGLSAKHRRKAHRSYAEVDAVPLEFPDLFRGNTVFVTCLHSKHLLEISLQYKLPKSQLSRLQQIQKEL